VRRIGVGVAVYRDGAVAHRFGGAHDAAGNFATVGNRELSRRWSSAAFLIPPPSWLGRFWTNAIVPSDAFGTGERPD
jgi:hypothetical protein